MNNQINISDVKLALRDDRFKKSLPDCLKDDLIKYERNPGCGCNIPFYKRILLEAKEQLKEYFPGKEILDFKKDIESLSKNNFSVINCKISELENILRKLPPGRKQLAVARYQDEITVILNELEVIY